MSPATHIFDERNDWHCVGCGIEATIERFEESCPVGSVLVEAAFLSAGGDRRIKNE